MIITTIKEFKIQYDELACLLRVEWKVSADMHRLRLAVEQLHQLADQFRVTHVQLELDDMADISAYDQIWLGAHWMPKILRLPLRQVVLVLSSKHIYNQHAIEMILAISRPFIKFDVQFFTHKLPGLHWLTNDSPQLPDLLAEWDNPPLAHTGVAEIQALYRRS